ncbi:hypothetical protein Saro_0636 [Novosphingobium aromaticivorans DSM 12444]|uniref:Uncharacterized protein n=1 Tax=Novosphingobium aromaticivorans (strain ATCC 700278 / DSM 12444 / CCUG 56034 / CIP 105152 / NBRC 16084 / F199) TaxID=279238 RepID=Q2GAP0_NOVAD|nr:phage regulatory CII family protein [Novosphingobium aromaticivorans]ABD25083.1 hypothetical protein Saro_0636 [Novosphingobium aromaticivorans DSM 12444]
MSALARLKRAVRAAISSCSGVDGAAATTDRSRSVAGDWNNLNHAAFPPLDKALAMDEVAMAKGELPPIACAYARELGGMFVPHIDPHADEGTAPWLVMKLAQEVGEVSGLTSEAIANDGHIDPTEAEGILRQLDQHDRASAHYRAVLMKIREKGQ